jgi:hypothetical protein
MWRWCALLPWPFARDRDHLARYVGRHNARHGGRELERCRSRAASELESRLIAIQIMSRAPERALIALHVGNRVGGVFARIAIPEAGIVGDAGHGKTPF